MDANKLEVLKKEGYKIRPCCGLCKNGHFRGFDQWGVCKIKFYDHIKHGDRRELSVNEFGICQDKFEWNEGMVQMFTNQKWDVFLKILED